MSNSRSPVVCFFCRHSYTGKQGTEIVLKCRLTHKQVYELCTCEQGELYGLRRKEDKNGTKETDG